MYSNNFILNRKHLFLIKFIPDKDSFLHFPTEWMMNNPAFLGVPLRMQYAGKEGYFSAHPGPTTYNDPTVVCINALLAEKLQMREGMACVIEMADCNRLSAPAERVQVTPSSQEDLELLHMQSELLQSLILDQVRVIYPGEPLLLWANRTLHISITVDTINDKVPLSFATLEQSSEIYVSGNTVPLYTPYISLPEESIPPKTVLSQPPIKDIDIFSSTPPASPSPSSESETEYSSSIDDASSNSESNDEIKNHFPKNQNKDTVDSVQPSSNVANFLKSYLNLFKNPQKEDIIKRQQIQTNYNILKENLLLNKRCKHISLYRVQKLPEEEKIPLYQMNHIFIHRDNGEHLNPELVDTWKNRVICKLESIKTTSRPSNSRYVRLFFLEDVPNTCHYISKWFEQTKEINNSRFRPVFISKYLLKDINILQGSRVIILPLNKPTNPPTLFSLDIITKTDDKNFIKSLFFQYIDSYTDDDNNLLINTQSLLTLDENVDILIKIFPSNLQYLWLNPKIKSDLHIEWECNSNNPTLIRDRITGNSIGENITSFITYQGIENIVSNCIQDLEFGLEIDSCLKSKLVLHTSSITNILIAGQLGTGKSLVAKYIGARLEEFPQSVHIVFLACRPMKGKRSDNIHKIITECLDECVAYQPSILILDDIDSIICPGTNIEVVQEDANFLRVSEVIKELLSLYQQTNAIGCIATVSSLSATVQALGGASSSPQSFRGQHLFTSIYELPELNKKARYELLKFFLSNRERHHVLDVDKLANRTEGFTPQDLSDLIIRTVFESFKRKQVAPKEAEQYIIEKDLNKALIQTSPAALRGVSLVKDSDGPVWDDIGGLQDIKQVLIEMLQWPTLYADIMNSCPLRRPSGILLYGAPGTGKTLLAAAVARSCKLNFISVKGPELLSKYIGASEEAVRDIFQKAAQARPCVLFFDEFDALAPKRGHDSTGVTDRVVNQLLTALDGVDTVGSNGVRVLAATGRPDLIDPALLRPGRLDRVVYVPIPDDVNSRLNILNALTRHEIILDSDVRLLEIAKITQGLTGADLQAVLYTAQIKAFEAKMENSPAIITQNQLISAIRETRPSLSPQDRIKYHKIYNSFQQARNRSTNKSKSIETNMQQRVTLA